MSVVKPTVYVETTIPSYLASRRSRDVIVAGHQEVTLEWWNRRRHRFSLFTSSRVLLEVASGDAGAAARRLAVLRGMAVLDLTEDAFHVAIATVHGMAHLLTWNCRHIANAEIERRLAGVAEDLGYSLPAICTPEQLMGH
jgi:hypothetical protein